MDKTYTIYFAGGLFTHKDLIGNTLLANAIESKSNGKYKCLLPQNFEQRKDHPKEIRDEDIIAVINCDLALFNYDGTELDSGTVVEYMFAKFADIPSVLLRTDFRGAGDCVGADEFLPWNLMTSFFPRTQVLVLNSAKIYKDFAKDGNKMLDEMAKQIVLKLDEVLSSKVTMPHSSQDTVFEWLAKMPNFNEDRRAEIKSALEKKRAKNLL